MEDMERIGIPEEDARHKVKLRQIFNPRSNPIQEEEEEEEECIFCVIFRVR